MAESGDQLDRAGMLPVRKIFSPQTVVAVSEKVTATAAGHVTVKPLAPQEAGILFALALNAVKADAYDHVSCNTVNGRRAIRWGYTNISCRNGCACGPGELFGECSICSDILLDDGHEAIGDYGGNGVTMEPQGRGENTHKS